MMKRILGLVLVSLAAMNADSSAQSIPTTMHPLEEAYRRAQLEGQLDSSVSFTIRPITPGSAFKKDTINNDLIKWTDYTGVRSANGKNGVGLLPFTWNQQYNSNVPYGWNDGAMIPARGYQTLLSGGFYAKLGPLSMQLKPEFVLAQNKAFETIDIYRGMPDLPPRFGNSAYRQTNWGQSNIRLTAGPVSLGLSNENLWWGPGVRNSLLMSSNAPGFKHLTLNSVKPIHTPLGSFEFQLIGGRLDGSGFSPLEADSIYSDWRYLSSFAISYQPRVVPGLFLGITRSFQAYHKSLSKFSDYMPLFTPFQKVKATNNNSLGSDAKDQATSGFIRWLFVKANAEVYLEYGLNDHSYNFRDFIMTPEHSRSYLFGMKKLVRLNRPLQLIEINAEVTQMSESIDRILRGAGGWYEHGEILRGYTHKGQVLGAGIGRGGNLQSFDVSWLQGPKKIGFQVERYVHDNDHYQAYINDLNGQNRWVDYGLAAIGSWDFKNLLLNAKLQGIQSMNYQWQLKNYTPGTYYVPENDLFNVHAELGVSYRF